MMGFFTNRYKLHVHIFQVVLVVGIVGLTVVRMFNKPAGMPPGRSSTMALGMGAKSLIILLYEILSSHTRAFKKWGSLKAYLILNALEVVFWGAVAFMMIQANLKFCEGINCTLSWVVVSLAGIMNQAAVYMTIVCWLDFRYFKANGVERGSKYSNVDRLEIRSVDAGSAYKGRERTQEQGIDLDGLMANPAAIGRETPNRSQSQSPSGYPQPYESYRSHGEPPSHYDQNQRSHYDQRIQPSHQGQYQQPMPHGYHGQQ
ncbi:hypothetical protein BGZ61DRAFT_30850 [Ilyonectria robusta]|uniref:uncharacterized protein n=1 Tax=Ilyonectria robusta TaxID=1079257 RepID=UPI001E8CDA0B|nr:uncharacterized protein BGZ61DRAFT_30850 [Ilyonectria robusta]KAH8738400.1 hypothetical protein BGZ61DRAFT_30850 [Ilyonectria robusta]